MKCESCGMEAGTASLCAACKEALGAGREPQKADIQKINKQIARWSNAVFVTGFLLIAGFVLSFLIPYAIYVEGLVLLAFLACVIGCVFLRLRRAEERIAELEEALQLREK